MNLLERRWNPRVVIHWTIMKCSENLLLQLYIIAEPNAILVFDNALLQTEW
jgi:hypothetical protein